MAGEQLRVIEGPEAGRCLSVDTDLLLGRDGPAREGRLGDDEEISRRHARLSRTHDGALVIVDLGSANGTYVNETRLAAPRTLRPGDRVRVGRTLLQVTDAQPGETLLATSGPARGRRLPVGDSLVIGRQVSGAGMLGDDVQLSRRHARISREQSGELTIEDLGSANGTFVNGERVHGRRTLKPGDSVRVGLTTLELAGGVSPARSAAAAPPPVRAPPALPRDPTPGPARRARATGELARGSVFAGCRVEAVIGRGDMGVVYRAEELALRREVALKLILPEHSGDERFRERFRRESRIASAIDHPNVIPIFDAGEERGALFITMSLVQGSDLRALIDAGGPVEPLRCARIVRQVGAALDAAHARGMLHRDVKPSNVLLARRDHVYLSDFGLAKEADAGGALTRQGSIVARAEYVAPEQVLDQHVDARVDVYALGCLLFEALTGEAPYASSQEGPPALAHVNAPPPSPLALRPELPRELDAVVRRAMAKDPRERYQSAGEVGRAALDAARARRPAQRAPSGVVGKARAPARPRDGRPSAVAAAARAVTIRWAIAVAGLLIVAVAAIAATKGISTL